MCTMIEISLNISREQIDSIESKNGYKIINDDTYRSLIYDESGNVVSFCPLSSNDVNEYFNDDKLNDNVRVEQYVEGTMINLFYDNGKWNYATRRNVGGENSFWITGSRKKTTFSKMFEDCCDTINLNINDLNKEHIYSFVMQHVDNRIINPILNNKLYLISVYAKPTESYPNTIKMIKDINNKELNIPECLSRPEYMTENNKNDITNKYASPSTDYSIMGINLFNTETGQRTKIRNPAYEELKKLRGNQAKIEYHYLTLRKNNKLDEFIHFFPEFSHDFHHFEAKIQNFTRELYNRYVDCYMHRAKPLREYEAHYKKHMFNIHEQYKIDKQPTTVETVYKYTYDVPEAVLMSSVNYDFRNKKVQQVEISI